MTPIYALTVLLIVYAISELTAQKTKAIFSTVLCIAVILLAGFWSKILPTTIFADAGIDKIGSVVAGMLITSLGATINFAELKRQWKVAVTGFAAVALAVFLIIFTGQIALGREMAISGSPIFAGGSAATIIMTTALKEKGLAAAGTYCVVLYVTQKFFGIPVASIALRREAKNFLQTPQNLQIYSGEQENRETVIEKIRLLQLPQWTNRPSVYVAKIAAVACVANFTAKLLGGKIHYMVMAFIMGAIFYALGFLDENILGKTKSDFLITFLTTLVIFNNLATTTPQQVIESVVPLIITAVLGTAGIFIAAFICSKALKIGFCLSVALGMSCTFGFPTTMLMPKEVAQAIGTTSQEKTAIENYLLPKMLTAGFVTVTMASVFLAGIVVNML